MHKNCIPHFVDFQWPMPRFRKKKLFKNNSDKLILLIILKLVADAKSLIL